MEHWRRFGQHRRGLRFWSRSQQWGQRCLRQRLRRRLGDRSRDVRLLRCFPFPLREFQRLFPLVLLLHEEGPSKSEEDNADYNVFDHERREKRISYCFPKIFPYLRRFFEIACSCHCPTWRITRRSCCGATPGGPPKWHQYCWV